MKHVAMVWPNHYGYGESWTWAIWQEIPFMTVEDIKHTKPLKKGTAKTAALASIAQGKAFDELAAERRASSPRTRKGLG